MSKLVIGFATMLSIVLGMTVASAQPLPAPGFPDPALTFVPPTTGVLADEFTGDELSNLWWRAVSEEQAARGGGVTVDGGICVMTSELTPVGVEGGPVGLISRVGPFTPQSFTLRAELELGPRQGEYGVFLIVSDLTSPGESSAHAMGLALYRAQHLGPDGAIFDEDLIFVGDGAGGPLGEWRPFWWPGLFEQLATGPFSMSLTYDADAGRLTVALDPLGFSYTMPAVYDQPRAVGLLIGGGGGPSGPLEPSQIRVTVDRVASSFSYSTPAEYRARLTPFALAGTVYDGSLLFGRPATVFLDPAVGPAPVIIQSDGAPVPADGTRSYAVALVTVAEGDMEAPLTVVTTLTPAELAAIPGATLHDYVPGLYVARGYGSDYWINYTRLADPFVEELGALIVPGVGPGESLQQKYAALLAAYDARDFALALDRLAALRAQVLAQRGKQLEAARADAILAVLRDLERLLVVAG